MRVLVADDHPGFRAALESLLAGTHDFEVVGSAGDGAEAVELVAKLAPAVVVMDLAMPGMSGVEATLSICGRRSPPVVVALSGSRALWREARAAGARYAVLKDEEPQRLLETIRLAGQA